MRKMQNPQPAGATSKPGIMQLLKPYQGMILLLILLALLSNTLNLVLPRLIAKGIDAYTGGHLVLKTLVLEFAGAALFVFVFSYLQSILQTVASEKVARDLRTRLSDKVSRQSFAYIQSVSPAKLLTNLTSDIDSVKLFVSMAIVSIASSIFTIIGASVLLLAIDWKLGLAVLAIIPIIGFAFFSVLRKVRPLFMKSREVIDGLNRIINESILGAALIRVLSSQHQEYRKFMAASEQSRNLGLSIVKQFAGLIPVIIFFASLATLTVLLLGGHYVITGEMTLGDLAAFNSYIAMLIFPIIVIGFMSNVIAQATASYQRIQVVLDAPDVQEEGILRRELGGSLELNGISLSIGQQPVLKNISFNVPAGSRTAIIGPTAAGKTQLLNIIIGLLQPTEGEVTFDGIPAAQYNRENLLRQVGLVFQDSILFNMSLRENIAFNEAVSEEDLERAITAAELKDFIATLPQGLDTIVSERGTSLSGGQKQRIMLARALAINPRILLLDDFTARVDTSTERKILDNVQQLYPGTTLLSVTQKIAPVEDYDQIILLMEGEVLARGTHPQLMQESPEYVQIFNSQRSTSNYELQSR